jgi:hypothetical protein
MRVSSLPGLQAAWNMRAGRVCFLNWLKLAKPGLGEAALRVIPHPHVTQMSSFSTMMKSPKQKNQGERLNVRKPEK